MGLFSVLSLIITIYQIIKEACQPVRHAEYQKSEVAYSEPRREGNVIIIENYDLYRADLEKYGLFQVRQWAVKGKYNLPTPLDK